MIIVPNPLSSSTIPTSFFSPSESEPSSPSFNSNDTSVSSLNATNLFGVSINATRLFQDGVAVPSGTAIAAVSALPHTNLNAI